MNNITHIAQTCQTLNSTYLSVLNYLFHLEQKFKYVSPSQARIARMAGVTREHANRILRQLVDLKIIHSQYRHRKTCVYKLSAVFENVELFHFLKQLLRPVIEKICRIKKKILSEYVTPLFNKHDNIQVDRYTPTILSSFSFIPVPFPGSYKPRESDNYKKEDKIMKVNNHQWYLDVIGVLNKQTKVKLTMAGKAELCKFPVEALIHAFSVYIPNPNFQDPFKYICKLSWEYVRNKRLQTNKDLPDQLRKQFGIEVTHPFVEDSPVQEIRKQQREIKEDKKEQLDDFANSWNNKSAQEQAQQKEEGLARIKDPVMREFLGAFFERCKEQARMCKDEQK